MIKNSQQGVSLIITFFITIIILAVVLSVSVILYSEVKVIRNMGNSMVSFYAADSGIEKVLFYDRQVVSGVGATRGLCTIFTNCVEGTSGETSIYCNNPVVTPLVSGGCDADVCNNCQLTFDTTLDYGTYSVAAVTDPITFRLNVQSKGAASGAERKIQISIPR